MEIVIKIDEDTFKKYQESVDCEERAIIVHGTPLPKGHGDLIDRSTLEPDTEWSEWYDGWISYSYGQIADADVVIKADGGEKG